MSRLESLKNEVRELTLAGLYFFLWIGLLVALKKLVLAEYQIQFAGLSVALVGALVLAKVVLILEHVPLGPLTRRRAAWVDVLARTALYAAGVVVVLLLEKGFEGRHEHGGFLQSLRSLFDHTDLDHVWANAICISGALLGYNALSVIRRHLGDGGLIAIYRAPLREEGEIAHSSGLEST